MQLNAKPGDAVQPFSTGLRSYGPGNTVLGFIPSTKKERAAAALTKKKIEAAAAAAKAASVASHCYYANLNGTSGSNSNSSYSAPVNGSSNNNSSGRTSNGGNVNEMSPVFPGIGSTSKSNNHTGEGRPSIGTITEQWEFMRTNFVNNSDEVNTKVLLLLGIVDNLLGT